MLGFLIDDLSQSQVTQELLRSITPGREVALFCRRFVPAWRDPPCAVYNWADAWGARFPLVAVNLDGAFALQRFPSPKAKFFYLHDLEWLRHHRWGGPPPYHALAAVYRDPQLKLVCRSEGHRRLVESCWGVRVTAVTRTCEARLFEELVRAE